MPGELDVHVPERLEAGIEAAAYFVVSETLSNVVKYADAESASVRVSSTSGSLLVTVADDGVGAPSLSADRASAAWNAMTSGRLATIFSTDASSLGWPM